MSITQQTQGETVSADAARLRPLYLTPRERQVVQLLVDGFSNEEIATRLRLRPQTVKNQLTRIYTKAGVSSRVQLAVAALRQGLPLPR